MLTDTGLWVAEFEYSISRLFEKAEWAYSILFPFSGFSYSWKNFNGEFEALRGGCLLEIIAGFNLKHRERETWQRCGETDIPPSLDSAPSSQDEHPLF